MMPEASRNIQRIKRILVHSFERARPILKNLHPSDLAGLLEELPLETQKKILGLMPAEVASEALSEMDEDAQPEELLSSLPPDVMVGILEELDYDDAADLLAQLPTHKLRKIFDLIPKEDSLVIQRLMDYEEESAGGLMNPEVLKVSGDLTRRQALEEIILQSEEMEDFYAIYVVEPDDTLIGVVAIKDLLRAKASAKLRDLVLDKLHMVTVDTDQEEVARIMAKYNLPAVPVVDDQQKLLGRVTFDDIMDVMETESTEDLLKIVGVSEDESLRGTWWDAVKSRLPWLLINVVTASTAGFVVSMFSSTLEKIVILASYMPVIAGVAGNGATQTLAVTIRLLATEEIPEKRYWNVILKEISVGLLNGAVIGGIVSLVAYFTQANPLLGLVVFMAMVCNLFIAGFAGSAVPLFLQRIKVDPAVASSILITAFTDILGFSLLLGFATWILL